jgi:putative ABC transport system permease protein
MERAPEIGLMKALGATDRSVVGLVLTEIVLVGSLGGILGYLAGLGLAQLIGASVFASAIAFKPIVIPIVSVLVLGVILVGSIPSIRLLLSLRPAEVLHGR